MKSIPPILEKIEYLPFNDFKELAESSQQAILFTRGLNETTLFDASGYKKGVLEHFWYESFIKGNTQNKKRLVSSKDQSYAFNVLARYQDKEGLNMIAQNTSYSELMRRNARMELGQLNKNDQKSIADYCRPLLDSSEAKPSVPTKITKREKRILEGMATEEDIRGAPACSTGVGSPFWIPEDMSSSQEVAYSKWEDSR